MSAEQTGMSPQRALPCLSVPLGSAPYLVSELSAFRTPLDFICLLILPLPQTLSDYPFLGWPLPSGHSVWVMTILQLLARIWLPPKSTRDASCGPGVYSKICSRLSPAEALVGGCVAPHGGPNARRHHSHPNSWEWSSLELCSAQPH